MLRLVNPLYMKLGYESRQDDTHLDILLRRRIVRDSINHTHIFITSNTTPQVSWACSMGSDDCQQKAREKFADWMGMVQPDDEQENP